MASLTRSMLGACTLNLWFRFERNCSCGSLISFLQSAHFGSVTSSENIAKVVVTISLSERCNRPSLNIAEVLVTM